MMHQSEIVPAREYTQKETLLALLKELIEVTREITECAERDELDSLPTLVQHRNVSIKNLEQIAAEMHSRHMIGDLQHEEVRRSFCELMEYSRSMQESLRLKSKSILATLTSLQQRRFYSL